MLCDACVAYVQARDQLSPDNLVITVGEFGAEQQNPLVSIIRQQSKASCALPSLSSSTPLEE
jgi:phage terminase small subunit